MWNRALLPTNPQEMACEHCPPPGTSASSKGPGENAGVGRYRGGLAGLIFKMESHNHPSYISPTRARRRASAGIPARRSSPWAPAPSPGDERAALRRARSPQDQSTLSPALVAGVGGYGNFLRRVRIRRFEVEFSTRATMATAWSICSLTAGLAETDKIFYSKAEGVGLPVVYLGAKTGRDGVGGATMAVGRIRRPDRGKAPHRPGRRPLHRKNACWKPASN